MKMSYNGTDNGYAIFNQVRIPRTNLLMRHAKVSRDGIYSCAPLREKLIYGGMLNGRAIIVRRAAFQFAQTLAIATRYSIVRTQGPIHSSSPTSFPSREAPVITYQHQKDRLLTLISQSYVILFASNVASQTHAKLSAEQATGNHELLPYTHMLFCGLKAWSTQTAADGAEDARKMCGGHGFMAISGLPDIVANAISMCTFEGENFVMWGQVARYLMKAVDMETLPKDMTNNTVIFYGAFPSTTSFSDHSILLEIFKHRAKSLTRTAHALVKDTEARGKSRPEALNIHSTSCLLAGRAHIEVYLLSASISQLSHLKLVEPPTPLAILAVLQDLVSLFALTIIASHHCPFSSSFLSSKSITLSNLTEMRAEIDILLDKLLPDAVALTDAWSFSDASLASALGCKDGDVYNRIMTWTKQLPMNVNANENRGVWEDGWRQIKPFLEMGKARSKL
jgi:acyl-CoA oxidase